MSLEIPRLRPNDFETQKGLKRVTDDLHDLLYGHYPALLLVANPQSRRRHTARPDIPAMHFALGALGFKPVQRRQEDWGFIKKDEGWHVDTLEDATQHYYPNIPYMTLRRHTAISGVAQAAFRTTLFAPRGRSGFKPDRTAEIYETEQRPGDTIYFMSSGGLHEDFEVLQAEHRFQTIDGSTRRIHVLDFDFTPIE